MSLGYFSILTKNLQIIMQVLCLDECTANMDFQTASRLQNTISNECKGITILTIAHRISTILNVDKVLIFDQGILVRVPIHSNILWENWNQLNTSMDGCFFFLIFILCHYKPSQKVHSVAKNYGQIRCQCTFCDGL